MLYKPDGSQIYSSREERIVEETLRDFSQDQLWRNTFGGQWEEVAELILPTSRNTFMFGNFNWPGVKKTDRQVDANGMMALHRFAAILDSLLTPRNMFWHGLAPSNPDLMKVRRVRMWFEDATKMLFKARYAPIGNFSGQNQNNYQSLGAFGTGAMFVDQAVDEANTPMRALRYKAIPLGELFIRENHQGLVNSFIRWFRLTPQQAWERWGERCPEQVKNGMTTGDQTPGDYLHRVLPNPDYEPGALGPKGKRFASYYISLQGKCLLEEGGYHTFPVAISRYDQTPGETYGRSPAMMVLPALKTLNAQKRTFLKQGHRAVDPVLLAADDGIIDFSMRPGALNKGGVNQDGKLLVQPLPVGNLSLNKEMMDEEKSLIMDAFLVALFQILTETPTMTATEVIERTNEKGILLAPTVGRQQSEYLGPMIERELDLLIQLRMLPPMPPELAEARGEYEVVYTSPLSRAMRAQEAAGFMRTVETVKEIVNITQDPSYLDPFDFDTAIPQIAQIQSVPESWMASPEQIAQKRQARAEAQKRQEQIQAAPAQAAMMKAQAAQAKAGMGGPPGAQQQQPGPPVPIVGSQGGQ
jgi:hypothetical protein